MKRHGTKLARQSVKARFLPSRFLPGDFLRLEKSVLDVGLPILLRLSSLPDRRSPFRCAAVAAVLRQSAGHEISSLIFAAFLRLVPSTSSEAPSWHRQPECRPLLRAGCEGRPADSAGSPDRPRRGRQPCRGPRELAAPVAQGSGNDTKCRLAIHNLLLPDLERKKGKHSLTSGNHLEFSAIRTNFCEKSRPKIHMNRLKSK